jgi:KipI family sensor histidine kinase inhibitor
VRVLRYGAAAVLAEPDDPADVLGLADAASHWPDVREVVPAARTVLLRVADAASLADVRRRLEDFRGTGHRHADRGEIALDVSYDGADLADTAAELGLAADGLVRAHTAGRYVVAFCGFAPGFAYLTGLPESLHVARHAEPRTRVPAGAVAIAGEFAGVYPRASPGGWRLLGHTDTVLWDVRRDPPSPLVPGVRVRFRAR